ncbi:MAG: Periplasmic pH-dependent serine endoprotease DegQ [Anaerolineales bacterium]|nr:Periplasmic pH-dependent serine endoprotease DegQ [Anaerolineales bacterium]
MGIVHNRRGLLSVVLSGLVLLAVLAGPALPAHAESCTYTVRPGDSLSEIAGRFGVSVPGLAVVNGIHNVDHIYIDQQLTIPNCSRSASLRNTLLFPRFLRQSAVNLKTIPPARPLTSDAKALARAAAVRLLVTGLGIEFQGTGSVIGQNGDTILTAYHVIARPLTRQLRGDTIKLDLPQQLTAELIDALPARDLALLRLSPTNSKPLRSMPLGEPDRLTIGDTVYLAGYPAKLDGELSLGGGVVIDLLSSGQELRYIVTNAYAGEGSSGGLAINQAGELIGIVDALLADPRALEALGYPQLDRATVIIPISQAMPLLTQ